MTDYQQKWREYNQLRSLYVRVWLPGELAELTVFMVSGGLFHNGLPGFLLASYVPKPQVLCLDIALPRDHGTCLEEILDQTNSALRSYNGFFRRPASLFQDSEGLGPLAIQHGRRQ